MYNRNMKIVFSAILCILGFSPAYSVDYSNNPNNPINLVGGFSNFSYNITSPEWSKTLGIGLNIINENNNSNLWYTFGKGNLIHNTSNLNSNLLSINTSYGSLSNSSEKIIHNTQLTDALRINYNLTYPNSINGSAYIVLVASYSGIELIKGQTIGIKFNIDSNVISSSLDNISEEIIVSIFEGDIFSEHSARPFLSTLNNLYIVPEYTIITDQSRLSINSNSLQIVKPQLANLSLNHSLYSERGNHSEALPLTHSNIVETLSGLQLENNINTISFQISIRLPFDTSGIPVVKTHGFFEIYNFQLKVLN